MVKLFRRGTLQCGRAYPLDRITATATMAEIFGNNFLMEGCRDGGESRKAGSVARKGLHVLREGRRGLEGTAQAARGTERPPRKGRRRRIRDGHELHLLRRP